MFSSLLVAAATWIFSKRGWLSIYKPVFLVLSGIITGFLNAFLTQTIVFAGHLPPYQGTLPVYSFFLRATSNETFSALAEKLFVEIADKTISLVITAVVVYLLQDLLTYYKKILENQRTAG